MYNSEFHTFAKRHNQQAFFSFHWCQSFHTTPTPLHVCIRLALLLYVLSIPCHRRWPHLLDSLRYPPYTEKKSRWLNWMLQRKPRRSFLAGLLPFVVLGAAASVLMKVRRWCHQSNVLCVGWGVWPNFSTVNAACLRRGTLARLCYPSSPFNTAI